MLFRSLYPEPDDIDTLNTKVNKAFNTYTIRDSVTDEIVEVIDEVTWAQAVSNYQYELEVNDSRRQIKVIKNIYYDQIMREFRKMVGNVPAYIRTVA